MSCWGAIKFVLFLSCRDAAPLIGSRMDRQLAARDHAAVALHLAICRPCRRYRGQLVLLRRMLALSSWRRPQPNDERLPPNARLRIAAELERRASA